MNPPLTQPDCDLQDFPFMPLHVARLRDSDLAATVDPEAAWYAVMLWAASWHQIPAASLPNDEMVLTRLCGLGRDVKTFRKCREGALHGFVLCDDNRLYHPVVAEQANAAWKAKQEQRWRTECARIKKFNQRNGTDYEFPTLEDFIASGCEPVPMTASSKSPQCPQSVSPECPQGHGGDVPRENTSKRQGEGQGQRDTIIDANASILEVAQIDEEPEGDNLKPEHFVEAWNELAGKLAKPRIRDLTPERRQKLKARINGHTIEDFQEVLGNIERSPFLSSEKGKFCTFDWVLSKGNFQKILEGNYNS